MAYHSQAPTRPLQALSSSCSASSWRPGSLTLFLMLGLCGLPPAALAEEPIMVPDDDDWELETNVEDGMGSGAFVDLIRGDWVFWFLSVNLCVLLVLVGFTWRRNRKTLVEVYLATDSVIPADDPAGGDGTQHWCVVLCGKVAARARGVGWGWLPPGAATREIFKAATSRRRVGGADLSPRMDAGDPCVPRTLCFCLYFFFFFFCPPPADRSNDIPFAAVSSSSTCLCRPSLPVGRPLPTFYV